MKRRRSLNMKAKVKASPFLTGFTVRFRNFIWFLIFTFTLYCMPHLESLLPYEIHISFSEAEAAEVEASEPQATETQAERNQETATEEASASAESSSIEPSAEASSAAASSVDGSPEMGFSSVSFKVDDFTGAAHLSYPIVAPPGRSGLSPQLSLSYTSSGGNSWLGVGWDIPIGYIQRRGPRKGVPKYDDTKDVYELNLGGASQELVCIANCPPGGGSPREYRLKIEGAYLKITYDVSNNYWEVWDKSGNKMRFGISTASRIGKVRNPPNGTDTYRWCLDRVEDPKTNYMELLYGKDEEQIPGGQWVTYQIYLQEINYNGQDSGSLPHNHRAIFNLESSNRSDPIYNYRGGFKTLTRKRLSSIEVKTNETPVRKYQLGYTISNTRSLLSQVTLYGNDYQSNPNPTPLPPTVFTYQAIDMQDVNNRGFGGETDWSNPSAWSSTKGNLIRNLDILGRGTYTDVIDMDGDALPDRVVYDRWTSEYKTWKVYFNNKSSFDPGVDWPNPSSWDNILGNYIRNIERKDTYTDVIDMNGNGLPDRVVYDKDYVYNSQNPQPAYWEVYLNDGNEFQTPPISWRNPSPWSDTLGNLIRNSDSHGIITDVIDMNGDGLPDRVVYDRTAPYIPPNSYWTVYFNNGNGFDDGVPWCNPSAWDDIWGNYIRNTKSLYGTYTDVIDMNGDGLPDRVVYDRWTSEYKTWKVYFNNGSGFGPGVDWPNPSAWHATKGNLIRNDYTSGGYNYGTYTDVIDMDGDGIPDRVVYDKTSPYYTWSVYFNKGPFSDLLSKVENSIGGTTEITYLPSTAYEDGSGNKVNHIPFVVQTVRSYTQNDGRNNSYLYKYFYSDASYDPAEVEFRGFKYVTAYQMYDAETYESKTETTFYQDYYKKGKVETQILTSKEGHMREVDNIWTIQDNGNGTKFPRLDQTTSIITDIGAGGPYTYSHSTIYTYDQYFNVAEEHKWHLEGSQWSEDIRTYFNYTNIEDKHILDKPTEIRVTDGTGSIVSQKWMDYYSTNGNIYKEEVCKSDTPSTGCLNRNSAPPNDPNPVINYDYDTYANLSKITDPMSYITTITYDSTKTLVYETSKCVSQPNVLPGQGCTNTHTTTTVYDPVTGNLTKLIPPHLQSTTYSFDYTYDVYGRKSFEIQPTPIGGVTEYTYPSFNDPNNQWGPSTQHVQKREHIVGGPSVLDHYTLNYFDGMGRSYWVKSSGPDGKWIATETNFDNIGRVHQKSNPYLWLNVPLETVYYTTFTYDGLSRVTDTEIPDTPVYRHITTSYQGLKKIVTNQRGYSTAYTYDVYQRLKKVEEDYNLVTRTSYSATEYTYNTLGNLTQVIAAKSGSGCPEPQGCPEKNTTTMTYDSLSKKRTMTDPDMGYWTYEYDKSGNLKKQTDPKNPTPGIVFNYDDGLNRLTQKVYPDRPVTFTYDDPTVPYSKGKLTKVSDPSGGEPKEDSILEYNEIQMVKRSQKTIPGAGSLIFEKTYDSAGRVISITYPGSKIFSYEYDVAGNLLYVKDNATGNHLVDYSSFTALGQHKTANFPKPNNVSVKTTYTYDSPTARLMTLLTQRLVNGQLIDPVNDTYQNLAYQYDEKGNILTLVDSKNGITHAYDYDPLDRLDWAKGNNGSAYDHDYNYDRIGNITSKSDVGTYSYNYSNRPHAVQSAGPFTFTYDNNGNMTSKTGGGVTITINPQDWNYDNKPTRIQNGSNIITFVYDGNGQRVKKISPSQTVFYFGELYEKRNGVNVIHVFAGNKRVASIRSDGKDQYYHANHLGSASVITDQYGVWKERIEYFPFGSYREDVKNPSDPYFPDANYTFTDQEDDDELGFYNYGARLYDPVIGRFISPDRLVHDPGDPQALNRYTYCQNNPLIYVDPDGNFFFIPMIIGAVLGGISSAVQGGNFADILKGIAIGALSGAVGGGVGGIVADLASGLGQVGDAAVGGAAGGMAGGATNAALTGGNIGQGMLIGGISGAIGGSLGIAMKGSDWALRGLVQVGAGAVIGGTVAELTGGKFLQGALMGAASGAVAFGVSELVGPYADAHRRAESELQEVEGLTEQMDKAQGAFDAHKRNLTLKQPENPGRQDISSSQYDAARRIYDTMGRNLNPEHKFLSALDVNKGFKIGSYHFQPPIPGTAFSTVHYEWNIISNPVFHGLFDVRIP